MFIVHSYVLILQIKFLHLANINSTTVSKKHEEDFSYLELGAQFKNPRNIGSVKGHSGEVSYE